MSFRCCRYLVIITVQPTDGSVNTLFYSCVVSWWCYTGRILGMIGTMDSVVQSSVPQILVQIDALDLGNFIRFREKRPILSMNTPHWQHWRVCCIGDPTGRILGMIVPMDSVVQSSVPQILVQIDALDLGNFIRFHEKIPILSMNTPPWQRWHTTSRTRAGGRKWQ